MEGNIKCSKCEERVDNCLHIDCPYNQEIIKYTTKDMIPGAVLYATKEEYEKISSENKKKRGIKICNCSDCI